MRRLLPFLTGVALACVAGAEVVQACGEKLLFVGMGSGFRRAYAAMYPASIVLLAEPQFGASATLRQKDFQRALTAAGHKVVLVSAEQEFEALLKAQKIDLVLVDYADAQRVTRFVATTQHNPTVIEVATKEEAKKLESENKKCLRSSDRSLSFLENIDQAMKTRVDRAKSKS